jgi:hypothetical protein
MAQLYSQTLAALDRVGATLQANKALDIARRQAATEGELALTKLGVQKQQMEQGNQIALANIDRQNAAARADAEFRNKQLALDDRRTTLAEDTAKAEQERIKTNEEFERFNSTVAPLGDVYRMVLERQGTPKERIDYLLSNMKRTVDSVNPRAWGGILTTPAQASQVFMKFEDMRNDLALRQMSQGKPGAAARTLLSEAKYFADQYTRGNVDPNDPEVRRQIDEYAQMGVEISHTMGAKNVDGETVQSPVYTVKMVDPDVMLTTRITRAEDTLAKDYGERFTSLPSAQRMGILQRYLRLDDANDTEGMNQFKTEMGPEKGSYLMNHVSAFNPNAQPGGASGGLNMSRKPPKQEPYGALNPVAPKGTGPNLVRVGQEIPPFASEVGSTITGAAKAVGGYIFNGPSVEYGDIPMKLPQLPQLDKDTSRQNQNGTLGLTPKPPRQGQDRMKFANDLLNFVNQ